MLPTISSAIDSVSDPDPGRSVFKSPPGYGSVFNIRIQIQQVKFGYKNSLFLQIFHDFQLFKMNYTIKNIC